MAILLLLVGTALWKWQSQKGVPIPLEEVWAFQMPGTRDVRELEPEHFGVDMNQISDEEKLRLLETSLTQRILEAIGRSEHVTPVGPGFVVAGTGRNALAKAVEVLESDESPSAKLPAGRELTLFFYGRESGRFLHLKEVARKDNTIQIRFRIIPHRTKHLTRHFALISLGELPPGRYSVENERVALDWNYRRRGWKPLSDERLKEMVCGSFVFQVVEPAE